MPSISFKSLYGAKDHFQGEQPIVQKVLSPYYRCGDYARTRPQARHATAGFTPGRLRPSDHSSRGVADAQAADTLISACGSGCRLRIRIVQPDYRNDSFLENPDCEAAHHCTASWARLYLPEPRQSDASKAHRWRSRRRAIGGARQSASDLSWDASSAVTRRK